MGSGLRAGRGYIVTGPYISFFPGLDVQVKCGDLFQPGKETPYHLAGINGFYIVAAPCAAVNPELGLFLGEKVLVVFRGV